VTCSTRLGHFNIAVARAACCVLSSPSAPAPQLRIKSGHSIVATVLIAPDRGNQDRAWPRQNALRRCIH
jgi:hypothetical protein